MLTIAVAALNIACFPAGLITDKWGPKVAGILASVILSAGLVLFAISGPTLDAYIPGAAFSSRVSFLLLNFSFLTRFHQ